MTVLPFPSSTRPTKQTRRSRKPTKRINLRQARIMMEGLFFAREIGKPLNTHLIIHWGGTLAGDDADGKLFAKFRYLLDRRFRRKFGIPLTAIWVRERHRNKRTRQQSEVVSFASCCCTSLPNSVFQHAETSISSSLWWPDQSSTTAPLN